MNEFPGVPVEPVQRKYWNDVTGVFSHIFRGFSLDCLAGLEYMQQLILHNDERPGTLLAASNK